MRWSARHRPRRRPKLGAPLSAAQRNQVGVSLKVSTSADELHGNFLDCVDGPAVGECTVIDLAADKAGGNVANDFCRTP